MREKLFFLLALYASQALQPKHYLVCPNCNASLTSYIIKIYVIVKAHGLDPFFSFETKKELEIKKKCRYSKLKPNKKNSQGKRLVDIIHKFDQRITHRTNIKLHRNNN